MRIRSLTHRKGELSDNFVDRCKKIASRGYDRIHILIHRCHSIEHLAVLCNKVENQTGLQTQVTDYYV